MLELTQLHLARGAKLILHNANLTVYPKEKLGIIGHNGAGKSSLLAALLGHLTPDAGEIDLPKAWKVASIAQEITDQSVSVLDFALAGDAELFSIKQKIQTAEESGQAEQLGQLYADLETVDGYTAEARVSTILSGLGFKQSDLHRTVSEFSGGWQMRMNLARVLGSRADLILLDEPTNHLDIDAVLWLEQWIRQVNSTVLLVSHDRDFLDAVCTHTVQFNAQTLTKYTGGYSAFERAFAEKSQQIAQANQKAQAEKVHLQKFIDRFKAKATKAKQAQSRVKRLEKIQMIEQLSVDKSADLSFPEPSKSPDPLVVLSRVDCGYSPSARILKQVTLEIRPGDRIGLLGANGNGKTTLVKTLVGSLPLLDGERVEGKGLVCGYFAQNEIDSLDWDSSPLEHMVRLDRLAKEQKLRSFLAQYHFGEDKIHQKVGSFSGGEKSRLALALIAYTKPNLLLLDEPTNHLDIGSRQSLASGLLNYSGALVVVSHDRHLLESITDRYIWVHDGQAHDFDGDLNDYSSALKAPSGQPDSNQAPESAANSQTRVKVHSQVNHQRIKQLRNQIKKDEKEIVALGEKISACNAQMLSIDYSGEDAAEKASELGQLLADLKNQLAEAEEQLLEFMMELEDLTS